MNDKDMSMLLLENMGNSRNLIKIVNTQRYNMGKILTEKQFFALISLANHKKIELKNLSRELHVSTSSLCILLNKMVEQNYVYRQEDTRDRRNTFYGITEKGEEVIGSEIEKFVSITSEKLKLLDQENRDTLSNNLSDISSIVKRLF